MVICYSSNGKLIHWMNYGFVSCYSGAKLCSTLQLHSTAAFQASLSLTIAQSLPKFASIESVMPSNHLILCPPLLLLSSIFPSIRVFSNESAGQSFSFSPSKEYSGLISFKINWFDLLAFQGTLKGLLQHYSKKASILQCSAFLIVQLSYLYMTTGKTIALTIRTLVSKVMSLLFNTGFIIAFLPRSICLLISWLQSPFTVIFSSQEEEICFYLLPFCLPWSDGTKCHDLSFFF